MRLSYPCARLSQIPSPIPKRNSRYFTTCSAQQYHVDFAEQIEIEAVRPRKEGELDATFINKDGYEEELRLEYRIFDRHVLVWVNGEE